MCDAAMTGDFKLLCHVIKQTIGANLAASLSGGYLQSTYKRNFEVL